MSALIFKKITLVPSGKNKLQSRVPVLWVRGTDVCAPSLSFLETMLNCRADSEHQLQDPSNFSSHLVSHRFENPNTHNVPVSFFSSALSDFQATPKKRGSELYAEVGR